MRAMLATFWQNPRAVAAAFVLLALAFVLPGQGSIPPLDRDESRFAQSSRQMVESGDYIDIRFQDVPRHLQPAGIYWAQAGVIKALGQQDRREIWPHRVPSWVSAICAAALTWWLGALMFGRDAGRFAGLLMLAGLSLNVEARFAKIDATLSLAILTAQAALAKIYLAAREQKPRPHWAWAVMFWAAFGLGVLLKGPIIALVCGATILALSLLDRDARWLLGLRPLWGAPLMLAIALPWYVAIGVVTQGQFYATAIGYSVVGKVADSHQSHGGPPGYHLLLFTGMFWPGSLFAILAAPFALAGRKTPAVRFCLAWILPAWVVFELSGTKLPHYTLPLLPAVAMLAGAFLAQAAPGKRFLAAPRAFAIALIPWLIFGAVPVLGVAGLVHYEQGALHGLAWAFAALALIAALKTLVFAALGRPRMALAAAVWAALLAYGGSFGVSFPSLTNAFMSPRIAAAATAHAPCPTSRLITTPYHEPSLVFATGGTVRLAKSAEEAAAMFVADGPCAMALIDEDRREAFTAALAAAGAAAEPRAVIEGYNYNEGDRQRLTLLTPR